MVPKITVIGETQYSKKKKPIELLYLLVKSYGDNGFEMQSEDGGRCYPTNYKNIELICRNYYNGYDLIFCYEDDRNDLDETNFFVGRWNDGVV